MKADDQLLDAWSMMLDREWGDLRDHTLPSALHRDLGSLLVAFVQWHTESRFRAYGSASRRDRLASEPYEPTTAGP